MAVFASFSARRESNNFINLGSTSLFFSFQMKILHSDSIKSKPLQNETLLESTKLIAALKGDRQCRGGNQRGAYSSSIDFSKLRESRRVDGFKLMLIRRTYRAHSSITL